MEKKRIVIISLIILIIIIFISVYSFIRYQLTIKGVIVECHENNVLVYDMKRKEYIYVGLLKNTNLKFKQGQELIIYLLDNTCIEHTAPTSIDSQFIKKIKIIKEDSNTQILETYNTQKQERLLERK